MNADAPLLAALEDIVKHGSQDRRADMLDRLANLFIGSAASFSEEHVQLFDEVLNRLIAKIETKARFELSIKLSGVSNAPLGIVRRLAEDDDIFVARPVLEQSERLADPDLLKVARTKSQPHLLAISNRQRIAEAITDVLVRRGDREVVRNVAGNSGACLSQAGFSTLVRKAERDGILAEKIGQRSDTPQPFFHQLFIQATHIVQSDSWRRQHLKHRPRSVAYSLISPSNLPAIRWQRCIPPLQTGTISSKIRNRMRWQSLNWPAQDAMMKRLQRYQDFAKYHPKTCTGYWPISALTPRSSCVRP